MRRAHRQLAALVAAGYFPVVIGRADHVEVRGLTGDFPGAAVIESEADMAAVPWHAAIRGDRRRRRSRRKRSARLVEALRAARPGAEVRYLRHRLPADEGPAGRRCAR